MTSEILRKLLVAGAAAAALSVAACGQPAEEAAPAETTEMAPVESVADEVATNELAAEEAAEEAAADAAE